MKWLQIYLFLIFGLGLVFNVNTNAKISVPDEDLYINSPELSKLEKVKNIKNKKGKRDKYNKIYIGQKGIVLHNGYGILKFEDGGIFVGYFHKGNMRDGSWIIDGKINFETYEYSKKNKPKIDSNGVAILNKTEFRPAKEFEIEYLLENVFLKNKITYEQYLKLTGKDKLIVRKEDQKYDDQDSTKPLIQATGFNSFSGELEDENKTPYIIDAYYENDCIKHGLVRYLEKNKKRAKQEVFGIYENCKVFDPNSKFEQIFFDEEGKVKEVNLHKKDVSHIYGVRLMIGVETKDLPDNKGVQIISFQKDLPAIETNLEEKDIIIKVNNMPASNAYKFVQLIKESKPNEKIKIDYVSHKKINENYEFNNSDIKTLEITPKIISSKVELRIAYLVKEKEYIEYLVDHKTGYTSDIHDLVEYKKGTDEWKERQKILQKDFWLLEDYYNVIKKISIDKDISKKIPTFDFSQLYVVSNKAVLNKTVKKTKEEFKPDEINDEDPPVIKIAEKLTFNSSSYSIKGEVKDNTEGIIYIEVDGILTEAKNGVFQIDRFSPVDEQIKIVAIDKWGNRSEPYTINVIIQKAKSIAQKLEKLDPLSNTINAKENRVALIIGIEDYQKNPKASYANLDAEFFYEYSKNVFGVKEQNIKLLINEEAGLIETLEALNKWLPGKIKKNKTELIVYFAGHGLASSDGGELYILPQDGDSDLLTRTGISRTELHETIIKYSPKNVTIFLDTCYSGVTRDDQTLLASARPIRVIANKQKTPKNFTIFSASQLNQISSGLKEVKHGIFSYFLMKGLEGKADINKDKKITNGELLTYMDENISQKAAELGRQQNPSLAGDPNKVLISYR